MPQLEKLSFALGTYEPHIVECMKQYIKPGAVVYDIGANAGYLTLTLSTISQDSGQVFAFEPDPQNLAALNQNIQDNGLSNVQVIEKAVSDTTGELTFASFEYSLVGHLSTPDTPDDATLLQVQSVTLDEFVYEQGFPVPDFIKIDTEGAEDRVIFGADRLLREEKPVILAEVRKGDIYQNVVDYVTERDYRFEFLEGGWQFEKHGLGDMLFIPKV
ncbi:MAG: FkbM family methyltransferase [Chloroflexota bacterium]